MKTPRPRMGYTSPYLPPEIIWACGLTPVRLRPGESLAAADGYLPRNFSVEARALLAAALEGDPSTGSGQSLQVEAVVFLDEDDTSRRLFDVWRACVDIPALGLVPLPRLDTDLARQRYAQALAELAGSLASVSGHRLTADSLCQAIRLYNEQRALWRAVRRCWIVGDLSTSDWYDLRWLALTTDPESANAELTACLTPLPSPDLVAQERGEGTGVGGEAGPRLLVLGGMEVPRRFLTVLEACGARVIAEDSEADERTLVEPITIKAGSAPATTMEALAAAYLAKPPGPRPGALSHRLAGLNRLIDERAVQGVIAAYPKFADAYLAEYLVLAELFRARDLPALLLEDDGESGFSGQQRTRVEAFLEVLA